MELKDGKIVISDEEKGILTSDIGKQWLSDNKLMIEVEKKVEVDKPLTDEIVTSYINKNQSLSDKLYNENATKFLKTKLGDKITSNDLGKELIFKDSLDNMKQEAIKIAVGIGLDTLTPKHSALLKNAIDYTKLDIKDNKLTGFDEQVNSLKTTYPDLFTITKSQTPPPLPNNNGVGNITYDDFKKMSDKEKSKLTDDQLKELLK